MTIRPARRTDAPSIASVHVQAWRQTYASLIPEAELVALDVDEEARSWSERLERQGGDSTTLVAEADEGIVGVASGGPAREEDVADEGEVYAIYLLERYQGQSLGRRLFEGVLEHLEVRGLTPVGVWVLEVNPATGFYEHLGGKRVDQREDELGLKEVRYRWAASPSTTPGGSGRG